MTATIEAYVIIPESVVEEAAEACKEDQENSFLKVLKAGKEFQAAGLTPIYLLEHGHQDLFVVAQETFKKKLH